MTNQKKTIHIKPNYQRTNNKFNNRYHKLNKLMQLVKIKYRKLRNKSKPFKIRIKI